MRERCRRLLAQSIRSSPTRQRGAPGGPASKRPTSSTLANASGYENAHQPHQYTAVSSRRSDHSHCDRLAYSSPQSAITIFPFVRPEDDPRASIFFTTSMPSTTLPNTTCLPSSQAVWIVQRKNCEPLVLGPALAMLSTP